MTTEATDWLGDVIVETPRAAAPYEKIKFSVMRGTGRVWACNGEYVAYRPHNHALDKTVNPATAERHANFLAAGHYEHVGTFDEVQIFKLLPGSPFRRDNTTYVPGYNIFEDMRQAAYAAVKRDWVSYHDILESMATSIKSRQPDLAKQIYDDSLAYIFQLIYLRGGPTQAEVDAGLASVRQARGVGKGRVILTPSGRA